MQTLTREQQRYMDRRAAECGLPTARLMEEAGHALFEFVCDCPEAEANAVEIFCGPGNNGGDGYVLARWLLAEGFDCRVWELDPERQAAETGDAGVARHAALAAGVDLRPVAEFIDRYGYMPEPMNEEREEFTFEPPFLAVDALLGTGYRAERPLHGRLAQICALLSSMREDGLCRILSVDIPSGVDANNGAADAAAVNADDCVTFVYPKSGMVTEPGASYCGQIHVRNIGLSEAFLLQLECENLRAQGPLNIELVDQEFVSAFAPTAPDDAHKGCFGRAWLHAGSEGMLGAVILAAEGALRGGAGLIYAPVPREYYPSCVQALPSVLWRPLPYTIPERCDAVLIGPGLGNAGADYIEACLRDFIMCRHLILDADALNFLAQRPALMIELIEQRRSDGLESMIWTPHPGEFERLKQAIDGLDLVHLSKRALARFEEVQVEELRRDLSSGNRLREALAMARICDVDLVLKGKASVSAISDGRVFINSSGNPGMGKGGSGDVLAGLLLAFKAQGLDNDVALPCAVYLHGLAGDLAADAMGERAMLPTDLLKWLPQAFAHCGWESYSEERADEGVSE